METMDFALKKCKVEELNNEITNLSKEVKNSISYDAEKAKESLKILRRKIKERNEKTVAHNLALIRHFSNLTNIKFAGILDVNPSMTSKYTKENALPSIDVINALCDVYNIDYNDFFCELLDLHYLINRIKSKFSKIDDFGYDRKSGKSIFKDNYYAYFFVTNRAGEGIHEGQLHFNDLKSGKAIFSISKVKKQFEVDICVTEKLIFFNLYNYSDKNATICLIRPPFSDEYYGGIGILQLASDASSSPCSQRIIFSSFKIDREQFNQELKDLLIVRPYSRKIKDKEDVIIDSYDIAIKIDNDKDVYDKLVEINRKIEDSKL